jgi:2-hydroxychromene-2-carboxylate isomerase
VSRTVDYYLAPMSPWTYLGHERFAAIARDAGARVAVKPIDLGKVFPVSGGVPLKDRAPQRQAYRLVELARWRDFLGLPLVVRPKFFPVAAEPACRLIVAADALGGTPAAMRLAGAFLAACWAQERDIADPATLRAIAGEQGLDAAALEAEGRAGRTAERYDAYTREAIERGVFGVPTYALDGELFWGQDRLDFLARKLAK